MIERLQLHDLNPMDTARILVVGQTLLTFTGMGVNNMNAEYFGMGYDLYLKAGKTHFANGEEITQEVADDLSAGSILVSLPDQVTLRFASDPTAESSLAKDAGNPWVLPARRLLTETGLYLPSMRPAAELQFLSAVLRHHEYGAWYPENAAEVELDVLDMLPSDRLFTEPFKQMKDRAAEFVFSRPEVDVEMMDVADFKDAVQNFANDHDNVPPTDKTNSSWMVSDIVRSVPTRIEKQNFYAELHKGKAVEYLLRLTEDMITLSDDLKVASR